MPITSFGLSITEKTLAAAWVERDREGVTVARSATQSLVAGVVAAGWVKKPAQFKTALRTLLQSAGVDATEPLPCVVSLPTAITFVSMFAFPAGLRRNEVEQTVPYVAEEALPFTTSEIYYDIRVLGKSGASQEVAYVAAPADAIQHWQTQLESCGLQPMICTAPGIAAAQSQSMVTGEPWALLELDQPVPRLTIVSRFGGCWRSVAIGAAPRTRAALGKDPKKFSKPIQDQLAEAAQGVGLQIARVVVAGAPNEAFLSGLEKELGLPVAAAVIPASKTDEMPALPLTAIGAAMIALDGKSATPLNLLPSVDASSPKGVSGAGASNRRLRWLAAVCGVMVILVGLVFGLQAAGMDLIARIIPNPQVPPAAPGLDQSVFANLRAKRAAEPAPTSDLLAPTPDGATTTDALASTTPAVSASSTSSTTPVTASTTPTTSPKPTGTSVKVLPNDLGYVNIRTGPSTQTEKVTTAAVDELLTLTGEQNGWYAVKNAKGISGWVSSIYVEKQ
jgi:hypothetical protein